ncbi:MAG TPA: ABC transporter ATP-binding protein [Candidatus Gastranaerophilaceae bacterium]|nr:ABC transporter ATP-binding protein [Candidatus Gastranaerophilaceae bacterium]HPT41092.1 ABC transporter ATP-binding protein [Candidatus Gastranaerophilaceae bacterium]
MENLLEIKNLFVEYKMEKEFSQGQKTVFAVNDLSLDIKKGEILAIAGESGCGKSTLAKAILKLIESKSGGIFLGTGDNVLKLKQNDLKKFRQNAQIIFQNPFSSLNPKMKIYEILKEPLIVNKNSPALKNITDAEMDKRIKDTIKQVGLDEKALYLYPHEFSGGQRQRIAIARALILQPEFIVADEPVSALDVSIQAQIINLLQELKEKFNLTFLFISHDLSVIKYLADRVAVMYLGEIVELGTSAEIFNSPQHPYTKALLSAAPGFKKDEKIILSGDLPSPTDLPKGCKFHTRCPYVMDICKIQAPETKNFSQSHCANCHLYD